ncbi:MAG: TolC family protein [Rikenellaceae bacterium]|nr:TolC family protein [Rikenellaceae bacterium]
MRRLAVLALTLMTFAGVSAQQTQKITLTLDEAVSIALSDNPTIKVADLEIERQKYERKQTEANLWPQLSATGQYLYAIEKQSMAKGLSFGADNTLSATANLNMALFAPSVYAALNMNKVQLENAVEAARASKINLVAEVKKAYYNILLAKQSIEVLHASEDNIAETVENTRDMFGAGLAAEYDLLTAEVQLSNLKPTIIQTENSVEIAELLLKMYLGLPQNTEIEVVGTLDEFRDAVLAGSEALSTDISGNTDLRTLDINLKMLNAQRRLANSARIPTIAAFLQGTYTGNDAVNPLKSMMGGGAGAGTGAGAGAGAATTAEREFWWQYPINVGVQVSIPIFAGFTNTSKVKSIDNSIRQLEMQRDYLAESMYVQVRSALNTLVTARETMMANEKTVTQAQKAFEISQTRYTAGAGTILEVNSAELQLTQSRLNYSQAIYDYLSAKAEYDKIIGKEE